ncbi:AMP-binding protein [Neobacillus sp. NRS-1170]|uniref:AMP-binding protein n=1 Tax=Neobacillus sp. NRS-1170 TaxID=3233898 RepID=UPI003D2C9173
MNRNWKSLYPEAFSYEIEIPNWSVFQFSYYAIQRLGGIVVPTNPMFQVMELDHILRSSEAKWIICHQEQKQMLEKIQLLDNLTVIFATGSKDQGEHLFQWIVEGEGEIPPMDFDPKERISVLQYTGGTTGFPKGAMITHYNKIVNTFQYAELVKGILEPGNERVLGTSPVYHAMGLGALNRSVYFATTYIAIPNFKATQALDLIRKYRPTVYTGSPTMFIGLLRNPDLKDDDLTCIKLGASGAAPMPVEVINEFEKKSGAFVIEAYGMTEATAFAAAIQDPRNRQAGSVGLPSPLTDIKIVDLTSRETDLPPGKSGEVAIKGPQIMKGYWKQPSETADAIREGWFYTGDIGMMDKNGLLYINGRVKEMIISGGFNIYPAEVEQVMYQHPALQEVCVYGVPDGVRGENVKAVIVLKEGEHVSTEEIIEWCCVRITRYKVPRIIEFREELPKTQVGKILRRKLIEEDHKRSAAALMNSKGT